MNQTYRVRCPDCGCWAIRTHLIRPKFTLQNTIEHHIMQTECPSCDYLMHIDFTTGNLIEAYTTSISAVTQRSRDSYKMAIADSDQIAIAFWLDRLSA